MSEILTTEDALRAALALADAAPGILPLSFRADCCTAASRAAVRALERLGVAAHAVATTVLVWNPAYRARVAAGRACRDSAELVRAWDEDGSWTLGIGCGEPTRPTGRPGFDGHVVCAFAAAPGAARADCLLDLTLAQADRPERGVTLSPLVFRPPAAFWKSGPAPARVWADHPGGCLVGYALKPRPPGRGAVWFTDSPDWREDSRTDGPAYALYRAARESLEAARAETLA